MKHPGGDGAPATFDVAPPGDGGRGLKPVKPIIRTQHPMLRPPATGGED